MRDTMRRLLLWILKTFGGLGLLTGLLFAYLWALQALLSVLDVQWSFWQVLAATGLVWLGLGPLLLLVRRKAENAERPANE